MKRYFKKKGSRTSPISLCAPEGIRVGQVLKYEHASGPYLMRIVRVYTHSEDTARAATAVGVGLVFGQGVIPGGCRDLKKPVRVQALPLSRQGETVE